MKPSIESPAYITSRNVALIASLRLARDYIDTLLDLDEKDATDALRNMGKNITKHLNNALHLDAFDVGDRVIAESADLGLSEYEGVITSKRHASDGLALFTVTDSEDNGNDHEAHEMRLAD